MPIAILTKNIGKESAPVILHNKAKADYASPNDVDGVDTHEGDIRVHLATGITTTIADSLMADIEIPTVTFSGLFITTNLGALIINDTHTIVADVTDETKALVSIAIDDTSGDLSVLVFEKTTGDYGSAPAGTTVITNLKELSTPANGTTLTQIQNFIR